MNGFWITVAIVLLLLIITAAQHRRHAGATDQRLCGACGTSHPPFARFCRRCGRALGA
jgi:ribosomal protein L40E